METSDTYGQSLSKHISDSLTLMLYTGLCRYYVSIGVVIIYHYYSECRYCMSGGATLLSAPQVLFRTLKRKDNTFSS